jgi:hypothetical protein
MINKILFEKSFEKEHCTIAFMKMSITGKKIYMNNYSFCYNYEEDQMEFIADLLDKVYWRLSQQMKSDRDIFELEQYKKLQSVLLEILN